MPTFRLKHAFCLTLLLGVALMWWTWPTDSLTASQLLAARESSTSLPQHLQHGAHEDVFVFLGLGAHYEYGIDFDPAFYFRPEWYDGVISATLETSVESDAVESDAVEYGVVEWNAVKWEADWPAIEARAAEENWTFYRQLIVTVLAVLALVSAAWPRRSN